MSDLCLNELVLMTEGDEKKIKMALKKDRDELFAGRPKSESSTQKTPDEA